jgi:hypothetical protein
MAVRSVPSGAGPGLPRLSIWRCRTPTDRGSRSTSKEPWGSCSALADNAMGVAVIMPAVALHSWVRFRIANPDVRPYGRPEGGSTAVTAGAVSSAGREGHGTAIEPASLDQPVPGTASPAL